MAPAIARETEPPASPQAELMPDAIRERDDPTRDTAGPGPIETLLPAALPDPDLPEPPASRRPGAGQDGPGETVVRVTIGRVEVRAAAPPVPAPRRRRAAGPRVGLADYLKARNEARR